MSDDKYYSKRNPCGPFSGAMRPDAPAPKGSDYIEGFGTKKNLDEWADYSKRHSDDPSITGKKLR